MIANSKSNPASYAHAYVGLELLSTAILILDRHLAVVFANPAAENLFAFSLKSIAGHPLQKWLPGNVSLYAMLDQVLKNNAGFNENELTLDLPGLGHPPLHLACVASPAEGGHVVLECHPLDQQIKIAREEKIIEHQQLNRELIRNLAHEIKNPLGGIRGSAQLLERELQDVGRHGLQDLREYTQVIVKEADRCLRRTAAPKWAISISTKCSSGCARWCWPNSLTIFRCSVIMTSVCLSSMAIWSR